VLGEFLRKLDAIDAIREQTRIAMLLAVLTACRKAEVTGGQWGEIDLETAEWKIPSVLARPARAAAAPARSAGRPARAMEDRSDGSAIAIAQG
jgi:integrase